MSRTVISLVKTWVLSAVLLVIVIACPIAIWIVGASFWQWVVLDRTYNNLKTISREFDKHHDQHGHYPPVALRNEDGLILHSWRTPLLRAFSAQQEDNPLAGLDLSKRWDDPANLEIEKSYPLTRYPYQLLAIVGPGAAWDKSGVRRRSDFKDGSSQTLLAIALRQTEIPWYQPRDAYFDGDALWLGDPADGRQLPHTQDLFLLMADGNVRYCQDGLSWARLRALITIDAGDDPGSDW